MLLQEITMNPSEQLISRKDLAKRLNVSYGTVENYEEYGWLNKAKRYKGLNGVFYTEQDYIDLVVKLKAYGKLK